MYAGAKCDGAYVAVEDTLDFDARKARDLYERQADNIGYRVENNRVDET